MFKDLLGKSDNPTVKLYASGEPPLETVSKENVEIFAAGTWNGDKYTVADLQSMVEAFSRCGFQPPIKAGHEGGQEADEKTRMRVFGEPALGYVRALRVAGDRLYADLCNIPKRFAKLLDAKAFNRISSEIYWNFKDESSGATYPRVLKAIAFLGAKIPALTSLKAIESLYELTEAGGLLAYDNKIEFHVYDYGMADCVVEKRGDKYVLVNKEGEVKGSYDTEAEALAAKEAKPKADKEMGRSGGVMEKTYEEIKAEIQADYEKKIADAVADAVAKGKAEAKAEAKSEIEAQYSAKIEGQAEEIKMLQRKNRSDNIAARVTKLKAAGKLPHVWEKKLVAVFEALPDEAMHKYYDGEGKPVEEKLTETLWTLFENSPVSIFSTLTSKDPEEKGDPNADPINEVESRVQEYMKSSGEKDLQAAYSHVLKADPVLRKAYDSKVVGRTH